MNYLINITKQNGKSVVGSREVAKNFNKRHADVTKAIQDLISKAGSTEKVAYLYSQFIHSEYQDSQNGQNYPEYLLTRDGFSLLVMGFTGEKAFEWKLKYIEAFNQMEKYLMNTGLINELRAELTSSIDTIVNERIQQIEAKCSQYYRPSALTKVDLIRYVKSRLHDENDYDLVKQRVLIKLNATKWEDIPVEVLISSLNIVDESIRIINLDSRSKYQHSIFD